MSSVILKKLQTFLKCAHQRRKFLLYHKLAYSAPVSSYTRMYKPSRCTKKRRTAYAGTNLAQNTQTLLSSRIPRDTEHERYHPELEEELKECLFCLRRNEMMFDLEVDTDLIEQRIYERQALLCRYRYLLARARELGLHTVLTKYQPAGQV